MTVKNSLINVDIKINQLIVNLNFYKEIRRFEKFCTDTSCQVKSVDNQVPYITIESYRKYWADYLLKKADISLNNTTVLSNKWAFSTFAGSLLYEKQIKGNNSYFKEDKLVTGIGELLFNSDKCIKNFMIYGFGGLSRESLYIKNYLQRQSHKVPLSILLFDCSPYYYSLTKHWDTKIKISLKDEKIEQLNSYLIDFEDYAGDIAKIREDKKMNSPALHIFLGNIGGNLTATQFKDILEKLTNVGDYILLEYAEYNSQFFNDIKPDDYVVNIAKSSLEELLDNIVDLSINYKTTKNEKFLEISGKTSERSFKFKSMLRRNFVITDITGGTTLGQLESAFSIKDGDITRLAVLIKKTE